jgi:TonB family protein
MEPPIREEPKDTVPAPILDGELHLLIGDLREDVARYRRREAVWMSLAVHGVLLLALIFIPKWVPKDVVIVALPQKEATDLVFTPSSPPKIKAPETSSNQISQQRQAVLPSREDLRRLAEARRPPGRETPPPQPAPQQAQPPQPPPQPQTQQPIAPPERTTETAKLEAPAPKQNPFTMSSPGSSIDQAIHSAANNRTGADVGMAGGGHTAGIRPKVDQIGNFQVLTDTLGVDFGPYWKRVQITVQDHWDPLIPEVARPPMMKRGRVVIEFAIMKNGTIQGMKLISSSGDVALDRAAWGALTSADPLPQLPIKFTGDFVLIRAAFFYNPDKNEFE